MPSYEGSDRNILTGVIIIVTMSDDLRRLYEQLEIEQDTIRELEKECDMLNDEKRWRLAEFIATNFLVKEREEVLEASRERATKIRKNIDSLLGP